MIEFEGISIKRPPNMRQVIVYPGEDGYWVAQCPSLPPCISQGETKDIAIANIKEAIELYVEFLQEERAFRKSVSLVGG